MNGCRYSRYDRSGAEGYLVRLLNFEYEIKEVIKNPIYRMGYILIKEIGKIRWRHKYFKFPIEGILLDNYFKKYSKGGI